MERTYSENEAVARRLWETLSQIANGANAQQDLWYRHALFIIFLYSAREKQEPNASISKAILSRNFSDLNSTSGPELSRDSVYDWVVYGNFHTYAERLHSAYIATLDWLDLPNEKSPRWSEKAAYWLEEQANFLRNRLPELEFAQVLSTFDVGMVVAVKPEDDVARESFAAELAASCLRVDRPHIADLHGSTGRFGREAALVARPLGPCLIGQRPLVQDLLLMRLRMQEIDSYRLQASYQPQALSSNIDFVVVNPTKRGGGRSVSRIPLSSNRDAETAIEQIWEMCNGKRQFNWALAVVPQVDAASARWRNTVRESLVNRGRIAAVIDFPRKASDLSQAKFSAWLVRGDDANGRVRDASVRARGFPEDSILFIDAEKLSLFTTGQNTRPTARFIGALLAHAELTACERDEAFNRLDDESPFLARIFARQVKQPAFDIPGLCRMVPQTAVKNAGYSLTARTYIEEPRGASWIRGLDREALDEVLNSSSRPGKRIYVIGNNGEGKSFLLREIAELYGQNRLTVAISSGPTDRFPQQNQKKLPLYKYRGAKTSAGGVNAQQTAIEAARLLLEIHSDTRKLEVFEQVATVIGFATKQFLVPKELRHNAVDDDSQIAGIIRLSSGSSDDVHRIEELRRHPDELRRYKLGLRRQGERDGIVPFDEMSSGEQQIVLIAAKMVCEADSGALFLIDEPEISLHVSWQRTIPKVLRLIAESFGVDVLVATHSPIIVACADHAEDVCLTVRDRALVRLKASHRRSVETALFEGFRTHTPNNREVHERCAALVADFIQNSNQEAADSSQDDHHSDVLEQLEDMKQIISGQAEIDGKASVAFDIRLIEKAEAAIKEIVGLTNAIAPGKAQ